jgi:hypothetical protein
VKPGLVANAVNTLPEKWPLRQLKRPVRVGLQEIYATQKFTTKPPPALKQISHVQAEWL